MNQPCDCCEGPRVLTPLPTANRPGLSQMRYRIGTHATFLESMQARLSSTDYPELAALRTREGRDASMALLDAWATVGDVLAFYQERVANEGYLRTATERRSVLELARLIGYALRPGVSASVYLAYTIDKDAAPVEIPAGARVNSIPGPGEQMQAFEASEPLTARYEWSALKPRLTQPQTAASIAANGLYLKGTTTNLKANDPLLVDLADGKGLTLWRIDKVETDSANDRTRVVLRAVKVAPASVAAVTAVVARFSAVERFGVSADAAMTKRVLAVLEAVERAADSGPQALATHLESEALPNLATELRAAQEGHFTKLEPWVADLMGALDQERTGLASVSIAAGAIGTGGDDDRSATGILGRAIDQLTLAPSLPPANARRLPRDIAVAYGEKADTIPRLLTSMRPALQTGFYAVWQNLPSPVTPQIAVYALGVAAAPFGHNAPLRQTGLRDNRPTFTEWDIDDPWNQPSANATVPINVIAREGGERAAAAPTPDYHKPGELYLDGDYDIAPDSFIVIEKPGAQPTIVPAAKSLVHRSLAAYGLSGKTVQVNLPAGKEWFADAAIEPFATVRKTRVLAGSAKLDLAEVPITDEVADKELELGRLYDGLEPGRWLIVAGQRSDITAGGAAVPGVHAAELVMIASVEQTLKTILPGEDLGRAADATTLPGDQVHTFITLAEKLAYRYRRDTVTIYGNVVHATHGEKREEVLGSGDAATTFQPFALKQPPLTYVSAPTVSGVQSTLEVRVNELQWHEVDTIAALGPNDRKFITRTDDDAKTTVVFGNGERGARLPTGQENVRAKYRNGIGQPGNVKAGQISLLNTRPLGVKEVINPIRASGGADKESRDQARKNAPLAALALDRLVSTQDYADFARRFAGVGKAAAVRLSDGRRELVHVTIAGADDIPIETTSDLYRNLYAALHRYGDPYLPIGLAVRERLALVVSAKIRIAPDYRWDLVEPKIRAAVLDAFSFDNVEPGQDLLLSDAIEAIQQVPGVVYVDVDVFDSISEAELLAGFSAPAALNLTLEDRLAIAPARVVVRRTPVERHDIAPAQLAYLGADVPDTLILQELKP
jgi:predicted phage baseplate assembly protein